jgi:hypothetical protein
MGGLLKIAGEPMTPSCSKFHMWLQSGRAESKDGPFVLIDHVIRLYTARLDSELQFTFDENKAAALFCRTS